LGSRLNRRTTGAPQLPPIMSAVNLQLAPLPAFLLSSRCVNLQDEFQALTSASSLERCTLVAQFELYSTRKESI